MASSRSIGVVAAIVGFGVGLAALVLPGNAAVAADKGPPSCAKIFFRPLPSGQNDGEQEAGIIPRASATSS